MDKNDFGILRGVITLLAEWTSRGLLPEAKLSPKQVSHLILVGKRLHSESIYTDLLVNLSATSADLNAFLVKTLKALTEVPGAE